MKKLLVLVGLLTGLASYSQLYQVPVYTVTSLQPAESGNETFKAIDGDNTTMYHSKWYTNGIPDELLFYFSSGVKSINKIVYTPRQSGGLNGVWTKLSVYYSTQNDPNNFILINGGLTWQADSNDKEINLTNAVQNPYAVKFKVDAGYGNFSSCAEMKFYSSTPVVVNDGVDCSIPTATLNNDAKVSVIAAGSTASSFQSTAEAIASSFDNDLNTIYHSKYSPTVFPVLLNYHFDGNTPIDYLKYIPRVSGDNGYFGKVTISYNTLSNSNFQTLMDADFGQSGLPTYVQFPSQITPLNIQISVKDGKNNFASCAEMEFYTANAPYSNLFANTIYSALQPSVTQADINAIQDPFFKSLAQCLFDKTYVSKYRVQSYQVYTKLSTISKNLKVWSYDSYENPTGIVFEQGEKVALFVRNIPAGLSINLMVKDFETQTGGTSSTYVLRNGLNTFQVTNKGLGYIQYYNDNLTLANVEINIVSGKINGYFDKSKSSNSEWPELLLKTTYPMIDVLGQNVHLVYRKDALQAGSPFDAMSLIAKYDTIIAHERMLMGLYKYNKSPKNHQMGYSNHGGGYYAGGGGVNLDVDWGIPDVANPDKLDLWGIAHEFGHVNQIGPDLDWVGMSEVTNNIYSVWVGYTMNSGNHPYSRLEESQDAPATGMNSIAGGLINGNIFNTHVNGEALQGNSNSDVFKILVPFWQLELYYQLAGASRNAPILSFDYPQDYTGIDYAHWYGMVAEIARNSNSSGLTNGELVLNFVKNTCDVVQEDLTDFFKNAGFLKPIDKSIDDYGTGQLTITQTQIDATIASIKSKNYAAPVSPVIDYISAHSVNMFKNKLALSGQTGKGVSLNTDYLTVQHSVWHNAVAYETYDSNNKLIFTSISGSGDVSNQSSKVYYPSTASAVYAVGFDGKKILVYPATTVPTVSITSPSAGAVFYAPANITINAVAADADGSITKVEFYNGDTLLGTSTTSPYAYSWTGVTTGTYSLTAKAYDDKNAVTASGIVSVTVNNPTIPTIAYDNVTKVYGDAAFAMTATSNSPGEMTYSIDEGGAFASINAATGQVTILGAGTVTVKVSQAASGSYAAITKTAMLTINKAALVARADSKSRGYYTENPIFTIVYTGFVKDENVSVINAPTASTSATISSDAGTYPIVLSEGSAANYMITLINGTLTVSKAIPTLAYTGSVSGTVGAVLALTATTSSTATPTYSETNNTGTAVLSGSDLTLNSAGTVTVTASVAETINYQASSVNQIITINLPANQLPTVSITSPNDGATLTFPANVTINAMAADADGMVSKVEFYNGSTLLGTDATAPYSFTWAGVTAGTYSLTAKAYDDKNAASISSTVTISVEEGLLVKSIGNILGLQLFPNPSKGIVHFSKPIESLVVFDLTGKVLYSGSGKVTSVDLSNFQAGLYLVSIGIGEETIIHRVIKE